MKATLRPGTTLVVYHWVAGGTIEPTFVDSDDPLLVEIDDAGNLTAREATSTLPMVGFGTGGWIRFEQMETAELDAALDELDDDCCED